MADETQMSNSQRLSDASSPDASLELTPTNSATSGSSSRKNLSHSATFHASSSFLSEDNIRKSPDSEALVSSEDELDHSSNYRTSAQPLHKSVDNIATMSSRRPSYAAEFTNRQWNLNLGGNTSLSPTSSHPTTPSAEPTAWNVPIGSQERKNSLTLPWTGGIWNAEPARKVGQKSSKGMLNAAANPNSLFMGSEALPSPTSLPGNGASELPIPVPLNPQPRNYRSMSFSVGQRELEDHARPRLSPPTGQNSLRHSALQHRPSRPSLLSEEHLAGHASPLRSVFEHADDDERGEEQDTVGVYNGHHHLSHNQYNSMRIKTRSASNAVSASGLSDASGLSSATLREGDRERLDEYENALTDDDEVDALASTGFFGHSGGFGMEPNRRFSEAHKSLLFPENSRLENLKRQHWHTVGGPFSGINDLGNQSRRHSFAGLSLQSAGGMAEGAYGNGDNMRSVSPTQYDESGRLGMESNSRALGLDSYVLDEARLRQPYGSVSSQSSIPGYHQYSQPGKIPQQPSPPPMASHRGMIPSFTHPQQQQGRAQQLLYLVSFKACRADIFYVQEGTGLRVKNGDLVIVEADRGTDLGTVTGENVTWQQAKELKEQAAQQHYNWLMMFSTRRPGGLNGNQQASALGPTPILVNGQSTAAPGGMGMNAHQAGPGQDPASAELKPKMIKRLAQVHEIQTLRDKEANEAKAKRVCQQKVIEHRLPMEILDAEFQMDWKKLTFYYYADSYINFNSLVTDLFKIYKTRIWMSAMNPASFAHSGPNPGPRGPGGQMGLPGMLGDSIQDQQFAALQQHYGGLNHQYNFPSSIPRALVSNTSPQGLGPRQLPQGSLPVYQMRQGPMGMMPGQDFNHLSQQSQHQQQQLQHQQQQQQQQQGPPSQQQPLPYLNQNHMEQYQQHLHG